MYCPGVRSADCILFPQLQIVYDMKLMFGQEYFLYMYIV